MHADNIQQKAPDLADAVLSATLVASCSVFVVTLWLLHGTGLIGVDWLWLVGAVSVGCGCVLGILLSPVWCALLSRRSRTLFTSTALVLSIAILGVLLVFIDTPRVFEDRHFIGSVLLIVCADLSAGLCTSFIVPKVVLPKHCPICSYYLPSVATGCPECGWNRPAGEGCDDSRR